MHLKSYQQKIIAELRVYLQQLAVVRDRRTRSIQSDNPDAVAIARTYHFPTEAWPQNLGSYKPVQTGDEEPVPDVTIGVPTGGGKTLLACHAIGEIQRTYVNNLHGLVVWVVPSTQIYQQTLRALRDRDHPYRAAMENSLGVSPDNIRIIQREDPVSPNDIRSKLVVLMLMLPAASGGRNSARRMYRDSGEYAQFFPSDDDLEAHRQLAEAVPNLDTSVDELFPVQVWSSLANLLRINRPLFVIDEGHKAYSQNARSTILGFNPSFILQLTATPNRDANVLCKASGQDLDREEMIKIPIHVTPTPKDASWTTILMRAVDERARLETIAHERAQNTGHYIRPICLIQVERTGKDQVSSGYIHANQVRHFLNIDCAIPEDQIAIKSSDSDDIENIDLLSENCAVRFIITKHALQEGWDCAFAYMLVVLTNPTSRTAMTQLLGRILRQPGAKRTGVVELDKCRVFSFRSSADALLATIKEELEKEGLGDLQGRVISGNGDAADDQLVTPKLRSRFRKYSGRLYLPLFSARRGRTWGPIDFEADILAHVDWDVVAESACISNINLTFSDRQSDYLKYLPAVPPQEIVVEESSTSAIDLVLLTRELTLAIPNAWRAWEVAGRTIDQLVARYDRDVVENNFIHIIEEMRKLLMTAVDQQCEHIFRQHLLDGQIKFQLLEHDCGNAIGKVRQVPQQNEFTIEGNTPQKSLFGVYDRFDFNTLERDVAICLDKETKLLWWHRMATGSGYRIQGWKRHRVYPDFLASSKPDKNSHAPTKIHVIETKGAHLSNEDTAYKQNLFDLCNEYSPVAKSWHDLGLGFQQHVFTFRVVHEDEWKNVLTGLFQ